MKFNNITLYKPKGGKTYCFKIPSWAKPEKRHFNTQQVVKKKAEQIRDDYLTQRQTESQGIIFQDAYLDKAIEAYLTSKGYLAKRSFTAYKATILEFKNFVISKLGKIPRIQDIDKPTCEGYLQGLLDRGLNAHTRNDRRNILADLFNYAVDNNWLFKSPVKKIPKINEPDSNHPEPLPKEKVEILLNGLEKIKDNPHYRHKCYYEIMAITYYAGTRISEVTHLFKQDIEFQNFRIFIHNKTMPDGTQYKTKTKKNRHTPITKELEPILRLWMGKTKDNPSALLFPNANGNPIKIDHIRNVIKGIMRRLGFSREDISAPLHRPRHTFTTNQLMAGTTETLVQDALGHKTNIMTRHYTHLKPEFIKKQFDKVSYGQTKAVGYNEKHK
jgi:site-specific recombinase XerD